MASVLRVVLPCLLLLIRSAHAGVFLGSDQAGPGVNSITHPSGYTGVGGNLMVTVCIDPSSPNARAMEVPIQNIIQTWNDLVPVSPNLFFGGATDIPDGAIDFESVALHELGHCIGLHHPNLSNESGLSNPADWDYTKTTTGANAAYNFGAGADTARGSSDDARGDDVNLHWFQKRVNDPFTMAGRVDATTYSRNLADLPAGDTFAANADRTVGALLGHPDSEAVMQQGTSIDEEQRQLGHDDVATLRLGMSGLDGIEGTLDDYTLTLVYGGIATGCDINVKFQGTGFASCGTALSQIPGTNHWRITAATLIFGTGVNFFFTTAAPPSCAHVPRIPSPLVLKKTLLRFNPDPGSDRFTLKGTFSTTTAFNPAAIDTTYLTILDSGGGTIWASGPIPANIAEWARSDPSAKKFLYRDSTALRVPGLQRILINESPSGSHSYKLTVIGARADLRAASPTVGRHQVSLEFASAPLCLGGTAPACTKTPPTKETCS